MKIKQGSQKKEKANTKVLAFFFKMISAIIPVKSIQKVTSSSVLSVS